MPKEQGVRPVRPASHDIRSRDVELDDEASLPTACDLESYGGLEIMEGLNKSPK